MKKKKITAVLLPAALALVLAGGIHVGEALAYFTACTSASGRVQVGLNFTETETGDEVKDWTKHISIENTGVSECFVRVRVLAGEKYQKYLNYTSGREGSWELREDGYWYYDRILACGERTEELLAALDRALINQDTENGSQEEFNVIVVQEYTPVCYDEGGRRRQCGRSRRGNCRRNQWRYRKRRRRRHKGGDRMKKKRNLKIPALLLGVSVLLLLASTVGSARAALTYYSENYAMEVTVSSIGVTLAENGKPVSYRNYLKDDWSDSGSGELLTDLIPAGERLIPGKTYPAGK